MLFESIAIASFLLGAYGTVRSIDESKQAAKDIKAAQDAAALKSRIIAADNKKYLTIENDMKERKFKKAHEATMALARAKAAASGISGSTESSYIQSLQKIGIDDLNWLKESGDLAEEITGEGGLAPDYSGVYNAKMSMWQSVGSLGQQVTSFASMGNESGWWSN